ncbi:hypothetical protein ACWC5I_13745, partial [Kitasatospora sp. NPDC001574]
MPPVPPLGPALRRLAAASPLRNDRNHVTVAPLLRTDRNRATSAAAASAVILAGALLVASPGNASAQTVAPTTPGSSAFTVPQGAAQTPALVQVAGPSEYKLSHDHDSAQELVAVAVNLLAPEPAAPAPSADQAPAADQA